MFRPSLDERREYIANLAARVFCEKGYQTPPLQDLAKIAKISKAGLYHYFHSKEDILAFLLVKNTNLFLVVLRKSVQQRKEKGLDPKKRSFPVRKLSWISRQSNRQKGERI